MNVYNFALAFTICAAIYVIGDLISTWTNAWIPSVFVSAALIMVGYWTIIPAELITDSKLIPFGGTLCVYLAIVHMGTMIRIRQLLKQWKTIVVCIAGLTGMCLCCFAASWLGIIDHSFVVTGVPPLTGGIIAATTMQSAAMEKGLEAAALFAIAMYCVQGFAGYPLTALCLQIEGRRLLKDYRSGNAILTSSSEGEVLQCAGIGRRGEGVSDGSHVCSNDRRRIHHCNDYVCYNRRYFCRISLEHNKDWRTTEYSCGAPVLISLLQKSAEKEICMINISDASASILNNLIRIL